MKKLFVIFCFLPTILFAQEEKIERSLFELRSVIKAASAERPWDGSVLTELSGTAFYLTGEFLATDIENVRFAKSIRVRQWRDNVWQNANVEYLAFDSGIALLKLESSESLKNRSPLLTVVATPTLASGAEVYGMSPEAEMQPTIIRSIENTLIDHSDIDRHTLYGIDANVRRSFSGGPVFQQGKLLGIVRAKNTESYVIPLPVILHVIEDAKDGKYDGFPILPFTFTPLVNETQRRFYGENLTTGVLIERTMNQSDLLPGDVLIELGGRTVTLNGTIQGDTPVTLEKYLQSMQVSGIPAKVIRGKKEKTITINLSNISALSFKRSLYTGNRPYFLGGALVFQEMDYDLIHLKATPTTQLKYLYDYFVKDGWNHIFQSPVVLTHIFQDSELALPAEEVFTNRVIKSINGRNVASLKELADYWKSAQSQYIILEFMDFPGILAIERAKVPSIEARLATKYSFQEEGRVR